MDAAKRPGRRLLLLIGPFLVLALLGGYLIDTAAINLANIRIMKADNLPPQSRLTSWGSCRQAHITGRNLYSEGQYEQSLPLLMEAANCSDDPWALFDLGQTQYAMGDLAGAAESWQHTQEGYNQAVRLAQATVREGDEAAQLAAWQFAAQVNPNEHTPYIQMARLAAHSEPEWVEPLLQQAIEANPNSPAAYMELGNYFLELGDTAQAQHYLEEALALDPTNVPLLMTMAENAAVLDDIPAAIAYWQEVALRSERRRALAYYRIGDLALSDNNLASALAFFRRAVEINPENGQFLLGLANSYFELGCRQEATDAYQELLTIAEAEAVLEEARLKLADLAVMPAETVACLDGS